MLTIGVIAIAAFFINIILLSWGLHKKTVIIATVFNTGVIVAYSFMRGNIETHPFTIPWWLIALFSGGLFATISSLTILIYQKITGDN